MSMQQITESPRLKFKDSMQWLFCGDSRAMVEIPDNFVHCIVTSPPYWGLRKYAGDQELIWDGDPDCQHVWESVEIPRKSRSTGDRSSLTGGYTSQNKSGTREKHISGLCSKCGAWKGSLGLEPMPELYLKHIIEIMRECRRVLRPDGVLFLNIGDSYAGSGKGIGSDHGKAVFSDDDIPKPSWNLSGLKPLDLVLMPQRLALALQLDGWYVRSIIIWHKTNAMPESLNGWRFEQHRIKVDKEPDTRTDAGKQSGMRAHSGYEVTDSAEYIDCPGCPKCLPNNGLILVKGSWRPTDNFEYVLMLTKTSEYYCDREAVRIEQTGNAHSRGNGQGDKQYQEERESYKGFNSLVAELPQGKNLRSVWTFPSQSSGFKHYAAFPEKLPEICIRAATPEHGVCAVCGTPWARVVKQEPVPDEVFTKTSNPDDGFVAGHRKNGEYHGSGRKYEEWAIEHPPQTIGWRPSCKCNTALTPVPAVVLDPFNGTGRTMWVAKKLGRRSIGYDLAYHEMSIQRNRQGGLL